MKAVRSRNPEKLLLQMARARAKRQGLRFTLTLDDIVIPKRCPVLGIKLVRGVKRPVDGSPSLDRVVPRLGYTPGNTIVVSFRANTLKRDATLREMQRLADFYTNRKAHAQANAL